MNATRTGLAIASLAALATLTACGNATDGDDKASKENTGTPTGQASETPQTPSQPGVIDLTQLEQGKAPGVAWIDNGDVFTAEGGVLDLAGGGAAQIAPLGDYWLENDYSIGQVVLHGEGGEQLGSWSGAGTFVVNSEGTAAAWVTDTGIPMVLTEGSTTPVQLHELPGQGAQAVALLGDDCGNPETDVDAGGCSVFANVVSEDGRSSSFWVSDAHGIVDRVIPEITVGADVTGEESGVQYAGMTSYDEKEAGSCSAVFNDEHEGAAWETCDYSFDDFNAEGSRLLAGPAYRDGFGDREIAILGAFDGDVLAAPEVADTASITSTVWEDADHVLATVYQDGTWAIVRIGADGSVELALAPQPGGEEDGLVLQTR